MLLESGPHGLIVAAVNAPAKHQGVSRGLRFTDAKARCPDLASEDIDRAADARALTALGHWMIRIAPMVAIDGLDGLMIETTGCAHLYGGEDGMVQDISRLFDRDKIPVQWGLASTPGAASALARAKPGTRLAPGGEGEGLANLPVSALRLSDDAQLLLRRFGLTRIGQLYDIDRIALARRFRSREAADAVRLRLDQALGLRREPLDPLRPAPSLSARLPCPEPIGSSEAIEAGLETLAHNLCVELAGLGQGARGYTLLAFRADGGVSEVSITLARPVRDAAHIKRLFAEKIDQIDPGFGIDCLVLEALRAGPMETGVTPLSGDLASSDVDDAAVAALADRITAKLGEGSVRLASFTESHLPERAETHRAYAGQTITAPSLSPMAGPRPLRLVDPPERVTVLAEVPDGPPQRFVWRRVARRVVRADGPERISPEWWRSMSAPKPASTPEGLERKWLAPKLDPRADAALIRHIKADLEAEPVSTVQPNLPRARDYYRVEDESGRRYWVYRDGLYDDGRGSTPEWYVHGLFA